MPTHDTLSWVHSYISRLDEWSPQWRSLHGAQRPLEVIGSPASKKRSATRPNPAGRIRIVDFLSPSWERRIDSNAWIFTQLDAKQLDRPQLEDYLRAGGLIALAGDRRWHHAVTGPSDKLPTQEQVIAGAPSEWFASVALARMLILQLGNATFVKDHNTQEELVALITEAWHPLLSWHVDVTAAIVQGLDRHRFTAPDFPTQASRATYTAALRLAQADVVSRPLLLAS